LERFIHVKKLSVRNWTPKIHENTPEIRPKILTISTSGMVPLNTRGWLPAASESVSTYSASAGFAKLQELGIIMITLTYHQLCPYPSHQNKMMNTKTKDIKRLESLWLWFAKLRPQRDNRFSHIEYSNDKNFRSKDFELQQLLNASK